MSKNCWLRKDLDQKLCSVASDLVLHCLLRSFCLLRINIVHKADSNYCIRPCYHTYPYKRTEFFHSLKISPCTSYKNICLYITFYQVLKYFSLQKMPPALKNLERYIAFGLFIQSFIHLFNHHVDIVSKYLKM